MLRNTATERGATGTPPTGEVSPKLRIGGKQLSNYSGSEEAAIDKAVAGLYDSLPFGDPTTLSNPAAVSPKCKHHFARDMEITSAGVLGRECLRGCGTVRDEEAARRNRLNASRGKRIQRQRIVALGGQNLPGNKQNHDGIGLAFSYEVKSGGMFSEKIWRLLSGIPVTAAQTPVLIVSEAPGPGRRARSYVVVPYDKWRDLHQEETTLE